MARGDLFELVKQAREFLETDTKVYRRNSVDRESHIYYVNKAKVRLQIYTELETKLSLGKGGLGPRIKQRMANAVNAYVVSLYEHFKKNKGTIEGNSDNFSVTITKADSANPFNYINDAKKDRGKVLVERINQILREEADSGALVPSTKKASETLEKGFSSTYFLDTGHTHSVSDRQISEAIKDIKLASQNNEEISSLVARSVKLQLSSKFYGTFNKEFLIELSDEASSANKGVKSAEEKARQKEVKEAMDRWITSRDAKWLSQSSSDSVIESLEKAVILAASKSKAYKGPKPKAANRKANSASTTLTVKSKVKRSTEKVALDVPRPEIIRPKGTQLDLVTLINAKLTEEVRKRMTYPRLQNRSGRFASSVRVTEVTQTAQGFPSIGYTYMRMPYETFEPGRKQGSNERDPKRLINESIRAIAGQYLESRFFTRRM